MARDLWLLGLTGLVLAFASLGLGLNGDVQYVIGGHAVALGPDGSTAGVDAYTHRPLVYRAFVVGATGILDALQLTPANQVPFEMGFRLLAIFLATLAAILLFLALRERLGTPIASAVSLGVGVTLVLAPNWDFLQAEWLGAVLATMALATALLPRSLLVAGGLSGLLLVLTAGAKISTAPYALIALLLVLALDRRRAAAATVGGVVWGLGYIGLLLVIPHELRWLRDTVELSAGRPIETITNWELMASDLGSQAAVAPVLMLAPAALVILVRLAHPRYRWPLVAGSVLFFGLAISPLVAQQEGYLYRLTILPVLAAGLVGVATVQLWVVGGRSPWWIVWALAGASVLAALLLSLPRDLREAQTDLLLGLVGFATVVFALAAWFLPRQGASAALRVASPALVATIAILALSLPAVLPSAAWGLDPARNRATNIGWAESSRAAHQRLSGLSAAIGPESEVAYLAYGSVAYHMGNPTRCRYPSPIFLKVGARRPSVTRTPSWDDNLACFTQTDADWLVIEAGWLSPSDLPPDAAAALDARFDCSRSVGDGSGIIACPRR